MLFTPSRDEARRFFIGVWQKHLSGQPMAEIERMTLAILLDHPEYHRYLHEDWLDRDWMPEHGETNPFLHIGMHLAIEEQLSINQPAGVRVLFQALCDKTGSRHDAGHAMIDGLGEMIWKAQRHNTAPDPAVYLEILARKAGMERAGEQ